MKAESRAAKKHAEQINALFCQVISPRDLKESDDENSPDSVLDIDRLLLGNWHIVFGSFIIFDLDFSIQFWGDMTILVRKALMSLY